MNKKIRVKTSHAPDSNASPNHLPEWLLKKLGLKPEEEGILPLHLHLGRIYLPGYFGEKNDLCITSAPRPYFMGTAELLGKKHAIKRIGQIHTKKSYPVRLFHTQKKIW